MIVFKHYLNISICKISSISYFYKLQRLFLYSYKSCTCKSKSFNNDRQHSVKQNNDLDYKNPRFLHVNVQHTMIQPYFVVHKHLNMLKFFNKIVW